MPSKKVRQTWVMDVDDLSATLPGMEYLQKMKEHFPEFKITCFTPAFNLKVFTKEVSVEKFKDWQRMIREIDWIEIAPHGFAHIQREFLETDKKVLTQMVMAIENLFTQADIPFVKIFKAPYWQLSKEGEEVLHERGYTIAIDRNNPVSYTDAPKYVFNHSMEEPLPKYHTVKSHGHVYLTNNGLETVLPNLLKIPQDAEFKFVSEHLDGL